MSAVTQAVFAAAEPKIWTLLRRALWRRIEAHSFEPPHPLNFTIRLARDHRWSDDFARGAVMEYRRFCFLAMVSAVAVTPSEEIDEVWHLHLTYSRDYWDSWCREVLRKPLHHDPTSGSADDRAAHCTQYAETLHLYERYFGPPPAAFWPATHARFREQPRFTGFDRDRFWRLPHPRGLWRSFLERRRH